MKRLSPLRTESTVRGNQKHFLALDEVLTALVFIKWRACGSRMTTHDAWEYLIGRLIEDAGVNEVKHLFSANTRLFWQGSASPHTPTPIKKKKGTTFPLRSVIGRG